MFGKLQLLVAVLGLGAVAVPGAASAEEFTLMRDDGKVFYCTDHGGSTDYVTVNICGCRGNGLSFGQVVAGPSAPSVKEQCQGLSPFGALSGCTSKKLRRDASVGCDCRATGTSFGEVIAAAEDASTLLEQCKELSTFGELAGCRAL
jgi:hypothetical protein